MISAAARDELNRMIHGNHWPSEAPLNKWQGSMDGTNWEDPVRDKFYRYCRIVELQPDEAALWRAANIPGHIEYIRGDLQ